MLGEQFRGLLTPDQRTPPVAPWFRWLGIPGVTLPGTRNWRRGQPFPGGQPKPPPRWWEDRSQ